MIDAISKPPMTLLIVRAASVPSQTRADRARRNKLTPSFPTANISTVFVTLDGRGNRSTIQESLFLQPEVDGL